MSILKEDTILLLQQLRFQKELLTPGWLVVARPDASVLSAFTADLEGHWASSGRSKFGLAML